MIRQKMIRLPEAKKVDVDGTDTLEERGNYVGRGNGKGKGPGARGNGGGRGRGSGIREPIRELNDKVCCYKCGGVGHVAKIKCKDGSFLYCATQFQVKDEILNGIQYPHIPSAAERRNPSAKKVEEEPETPEEEEDSELERAQYAAADDGTIEEEYGSPEF